MDCTSGQGAMMAISVTSKNPERALMFLNLLNTDPAVMTLVNYGAEGFTYNKNTDGTISFTDERANYSPWTNGVGNVRILPATDAQGSDFWGRFSAYYDAAEALPYGGFIFDSSVCEDEAGALANVYAEYAFNLMCGAVDPATVLPEFLAKLDAAGINTLVEAAQTQMDAYLGK
ncbi:MAG: ABC transporter substrate-binding protein, partial [Oscillospiraceae bacterium]|nr:ABC transporter substrate-binding protein [Oscillospiraceae bacterium]